MCLVTVSSRHVSRKKRIWGFQSNFGYVESIRIYGVLLMQHDGWEGLACRNSCEGDFLWGCTAVSIE